MDEREITKLSEEAFEIYKRIKSDTKKLNSIKEKIIENSQGKNASYKIHFFIHIVRFQGFQNLETRGKQLMILVKLRWIRNMSKLSFENFGKMAETSDNYLNIAS